ncbi:MAG: PmoA family protein, partial [Roseibacillus sp.]|nr:PmoA family protein [Roseibacillus sp.]
MRFLSVVLSGPVAFALLSFQPVRGDGVVAKPVFDWRKTEASIALVNQDKIVWRLVYDPKKNKSCFHPLSLVDGTVLTELRPADHVWHYAGWFSWKFINGLN